MSRGIVLLFAWLLMTAFPGCATSNPCAVECTHEVDTAWQLVYRHDADGARIAGEKSELLAAIRRGAPIRLAWGGKVERQGATIAIEHVAEPVFLSVINGSDVIVHLPEHIAQQGYGDVSKALFADPAVMWRGLMTSDGFFDAVWVNRATGEQVSRNRQRVGLAWFALQAKDPALREPTLELAVPGGVRKDESQ